MPERFLIVGLGNPGKRYALTRHNIGFMAVDRLVEKFNMTFKAGKGQYLISSYIQVSDSDSELAVIKPLTFMNHSGIAVREAVEYFKFDLNHILIVLDDFQLPFGKLRIREKGSDGGHNGLASIIRHIGTNQFKRLRVGIGNEFIDNPADFVLSNFNKKEADELPAVIDSVVDAVLEFSTHGLRQAMNKYN